MAPITLFYWSACQKFWGRAIGAVLTLEAGGKVLGTDYEIKEPSEAPKAIGVGFPQVTLSSGLTIAQTPLILDVLGEEVGLGGSTPEEKILCKQYILDLTDVFKEAMAQKLDDAERAGKWFSLFEGRLADKAFLLGSSPCTADFYAVFVMLWVDAKGVKYDMYPKVAAWWAALKEVPVVKKMFESGVAMIPN